MPRLEHKIVVNADIARVFEIARDVEAFPSIMDDLQSITVLERSDDGCRTITEWVGLIKQFQMKLKWQQEDIWNPTIFRDDFRAIKGDVDELSGFWQFTTVDNRTEFESVVDYEVNVPLVGPLVKNLIKKLMDANIASQMNAIKHKAESV